MHKVKFSLDASDWHGVSSESVWAEKVSDERFKLKNTPFFVKGVSYEDVVFTKSLDASIWFESVSIYAGHSTYRILVGEDRMRGSFAEYWANLSDQRCTYESTSWGEMFLLAVDVPPTANIYEVYGLLEKGEEDGVWGFEEGHVGHTLEP